MHIPVYDVLHASPIFVIFFVLQNAVSCKKSFEEKKYSWLKHLIMTVLVGNGGSTLRAIVLAQTFPALLKGSQYNILLLASAWLVTRIGIVHRFLSLKYVQVMLTPAEWMLRVQSLCVGLRITPDVYPGSIVALIVIGIAHGFGGGFFVEVSDGLSGQYQYVAGKLNTPKWSNFYWSFWSTIFYIIATSSFIGMSQDSVFRLIIAFCMAIATAKVAIDRDIDPLWFLNDWIVKIVAFMNGLDVSMAVKDEKEGEKKKGKSLVSTPRRSSRISKTKKTE